MAEKLKMMSSDIIQENIEFIESRFPNVIKETRDGNGKLVKMVDFDILKQELSTVVIDDKKERYHMTWPDKKKAILNANSKINGTLRPLKDKSVDFENTKNIYIEGDNLDVLKLLRETYLNKIDMIYIDPPYNTGHDFIYDDDYSQSENDYLKKSGQYSEEGFRMFINSESNGRFHSDWLNMIYPRIKISKDLLNDNGFIFISIGDDEVLNLKKICDEIFGEHNFVANLTRIAKRTSNKGNFFKPTKDYVLVYAKNISIIDWKFGIDNEIKESDFKYEDENGKYKQNGASLYQPSLDARPNQRYYIECPDGSLIIPPGNVFPNIKSDGEKIKPLNNDDKCWRWSVETYKKNKEKLIFTKAGNNCPLLDSEGKPSKWNIYDKVYLKDKINESLLPEDVIYDYVNSQGTKEVLSLGLKFSFSKPVGLIKYIISLCKMNSDIKIMDFFSGSASTAQAVMELNAEDNGTRQYIMVQLPEKIEEDTELFNDGFKTLCDLGEERIRRAANKIISNSPLLSNFVDLGFRVLKLDSSNMNDVYYNPKSTTQSLLDSTVDNVKPDRTPLDLLFQVMLDLGIELSAKIEEKTIAGKQCFIVNENDIVACFDDDINEDVINSLAKLKPIYAVFKDSSFDSDASNINCEQIFKTISQSTNVKVI